MIIKKINFGIFILPFLLVFFGVSGHIDTLFAFSYLGTRAIGDQIVGWGLRSYGMGGAGVAGSEESATILHNPAGMNFLEQKQVALGFCYAPLTERVVTSDNKTYYNDASYFSINNFAFVIPTKDSRFAFGLAYAPMYDYNYSHRQNLYSATTPSVKTGYKEISASGIAPVIAPAVSILFGESFSVGLSYGMLSGSFNYKQKEIDSTTIPATIVSETSTDVTVSGSMFNLGAVYSAKPIRLGLYYAGSSSIKLKSSSVEATFEMPSYIALGLGWDFGGRYNTKLAVDVIPMGYSGAKLNGNSLGWSDITVIKIGVEHMLSEDFPIRYGYYCLPYYGDKKIDLVAFTLGVGYKISERVYLDLSGEYGKRNYVGDNNFFTSKETIDESFKKVLFGFNYKW